MLEVADDTQVASNMRRYVVFPGVAKHVDEQEVSNCSGFQAMFMANTRQVKGLRTTGIGGVTCSRHNMWQANGMGDLQVGERSVAFLGLTFLGLY
jgi:hypothetical protein